MNPLFDPTKAADTYGSYAWHNDQQNRREGDAELFRKIMESIPRLSPAEVKELDSVLEEEPERPKLTEAELDELARLDAMKNHGAHEL